MPVILKVGGSSLGTRKLDLKKVEKTCSTIKDLKKQGPLGVVVGAGRMAGGYVETARAMGVSEYQLDWLSIDVSRLNAKLLARPIGYHEKIPETIDSAARFLRHEGFVVMGGTTPGHTTNAVAAMLAEETGSRLVNVTRVGGVFDKNPEKYKNAKKLSSMTYQELIKMASKHDDRKARTHFVFDVLAAKIIARSKIPTSIISSKPSEIKKACLGKKHSGTVVG
jgi:uridylate kinase